MNTQKASLFVLIVLVIGFFIVSMIMISRHGELYAAVEKLAQRVDQLETQVKALSPAK